MGSKTLRNAIAVLGLSLVLAAAAHAAEKPATLKIVASLFPQYDFARSIARDKADVRLLLPPGAESHSFEPTPRDMRDIAAADLFVFTGEHMEPWAKKLADAASAPGGVTVVDASKGVEFSGNESHGDDAHDHGDKHDHSAENNGAHVHKTDPHIWLSPPLAEMMARNIAEALKKRDAANADFYDANAKELIGEIHRLDEWFRKEVGNSKRKLLVFGERFAFTYFFEHYGLEMAGAYKSCAPGAEPGLKAVIEVIETIRKNDVRFVYLEDMSTGRISETLRKETGVEILRVDSLHNPPLERQRAGEGYVDVMRANMEAFAKGLR